MFFGTKKILENVTQQESDNFTSEVPATTTSRRKKVIATTNSAAHKKQKNESKVSTRSRSKKKFTPPQWHEDNDILLDHTEPAVIFSPPPVKKMSPYEYFGLFMDSNIIADICEQTNLYSSQTSDDGRSIGVTPGDIEQHIGQLLLMGVNKVPSYRAYWGTATRYSPIADVMPRNKFDSIKRFLHFNDNSKIKKRNEEGYDKLFKIRPFIDALRNNFLNVEPTANQSIDEIMIPSKASSPLRQYNKNKPHRFGVKVEGRAGADGILHDFKIYTGKTNAEPSGAWGISGDVVLTLSDTLPKNIQYRIFADNWFSSYALVKEMKARGLEYTGTIRQNRVPGFQMRENLKAEGRGSFACCVSNDNISVVTWIDNKPINLISSCFGALPLDEVRRWSASEKAYKIISRPFIVREYNSNMGGIDLNDFLVALYRTEPGTKKYYMKIFYHFLDVSVVNAWLLYRRHMRQNEQDHMTLLNFRIDIANSLIQYGKKIMKRRGRPSNKPTQVRQRVVTSVGPPLEVRYDGVEHWPVEDRRERCVQCKERGMFSSFKCTKCDVSLCIKKNRNCFTAFHVPPD